MNLFEEGNQWVKIMMGIQPKINLKPNPGTNPLRMTGTIQVISREPSDTAKTTTTVWSILATDIPFNSRQLTRISKRASVGITRTGAFIGNGSGEIVLAFSTANRISHAPQTELTTQAAISDDKIDLYLNLFHFPTVQRFVRCWNKLQQVLIGHLRPPQEISRQDTILQWFLIVWLNIGVDRVRRLDPHRIQPGDFVFNDLALLIKGVIPFLRDPRADPTYLNRWTYW